MEKLLELFTDESIKDAITKAFASKGKNKGFLKAKCPPVNTPENAAWLAIQGFANSYKANFGQMFMMSSKNREIYDLIEEKICQSGINCKGFDKDRKGLESIGAW